MVVARLLGWHILVFGCFVRTSCLEESDWDAITLLSREDVIEYIRLPTEHVEIAIECRRRAELDLSRMRTAASNMDEVQVALSKYRQRIISDVEEVLSPSKMQRLRQVRWRFEVLHKGLPRAITEEPMASLIGIEESQRQPLFARVKPVWDQCQRRIQQLKKLEQDKVLELLAPDQKRRASAILDATIGFAEKPWQSHFVGMSANSPDYEQDFNWSVPVSRVEVTLDGRVFVGPDPSSNWEVFEYIAHPDIRKFLQVPINVRRAAAKLLETAKRETMRIVELQDDNAGAVSAYRQSLSDSIEELLTPGKLQLLRKLGYRLEVDRMGIADAITFGRLSEAVGIHEGQRSTFRRKAKSIEEDTRMLRIMVREATESEVYRALEPSQREAAMSLLGNTSDFEPTTRPQRLYINRLREVEGFLNEE